MICVEVEDFLSSFNINNQIIYTLWSLNGDKWYGIFEDIDGKTYLRGTIKGYNDRQAIGKFLETVAELL